MTPVFIIEEHHEAFCVWQHAIAAQMLPAQGNTLLHVDEHSDMNLPTLSASLQDVGAEVGETLAFVQQNLGISEFILPAVYQGVFNHVYWMRRTHAASATERTLNVLSYQGQGRRLIVTQNVLQAGLVNPDRKVATFRHISPDTAMRLPEPVVLDIDLDYFYCDYATGETFEVQITEQEYRAFCDNPYHRLRMTSGGKLRAEARNGDYYYIYRPGMIQDTPEFDAGEVRQRIEQFTTWLREQQVRPALIDMCRSRHSGYTPSDHWQWIEEYVLTKLEEQWPVSVTYLPELLAERGRR
ncbi:hypothetical protein GF339_21770 [candidate division KSB3 bacterium]|uniref:Uncharacterized protein n=1 Tax=candidate division KSB3 bacterium TaxID=2044937 RepID=A0A9D5K075_9BACT|nr:hypothetical protein [candidate division KSB3 bacterium]